YDQTEFFRKQNRTILQINSFAVILGLIAELIVDAPLLNKISLGIVGGGLTLFLFFLHFNNKAIRLITFGSVLGIAIVSAIIMYSSTYFTNIFFVFFLLAVSAVSLSERVLSLGGILGLGLITFFILDKGHLHGFNTRTFVMTLVFYVLVF